MVSFLTHTVVEADPEAVVYPVDDISGEARVRVAQEGAIPLLHWRGEVRQASCGGSGRRAAGRDCWITRSLLCRGRLLQRK